MPSEFSLLITGLKISWSYLFRALNKENPANAAAANNESNDKSLGFILITMSALFIVCQSLKIVPDLYELFVCKTQDLVGHHCKMDGPVSWFLNIKSRIASTDVDDLYILLYFYFNEIFFEEFIKFFFNRSSMELWEYLIFWCASIPQSIFWFTTFTAPNSERLGFKPMDHFMTDFKISSGCWKDQMAWIQLNLEILLSEVIFKTISTVENFTNFS